MENGEFRRLDPELTGRLVFAPLVLMVIYRYSFDCCGGQSLDPDAYIEQHLDLLLRGLAAPEGRRLRAVRSGTARGTR